MNKGFFRTADGKNHLFTFCLVSSLFFLWALCNGMIDVMDKHFQDYLHLSKSESAWVQFAHYVGYFLMAMPAGWLAKKLGYKGGILAGLGLVAIGCLWFIPATQVPALSHFWSFLLGVCMIAMGLTFLETIANPYTTVLGPPEYGATRINMAQSCNGVGWILGPIVGGMFFYSSKGTEASHQTLWIPYACVAGGVVALMIAFVFAKLPDLVGADACHVDEDAKQPEVAVKHDREVKRGLCYVLSLLNFSVLAGTVGALFAVISSICGTAKKVAEGPAVANAFGEKIIGLASSLPSFGAKVTIDSAPWLIGAWVTLVLVAIAAVFLMSSVKKMHNSSIWSHPHFSSATMAQFFYVAAQAGIFSFFINYMVSETPSVSGGNSFLRFLLGGDSGVHLKDGLNFISEQGATKLLSIGFGCFLAGRMVGSALLTRASAHKLLGIYSVVNIALMLVIVAKTGWISTLAVFLSFFFMSIMFPTIFALGIFGLGSKTKMASSFIVMSITGGALMPKVMGLVGDHYNMSLSFWVPFVCFIPIAAYGFFWSKLSGAQGLVGVDASKGH